jgi:hypothetical protein
MPHAALARRHTAKSLVERLLDAPRLPAAVRALTPLEFAAAVQRVGVEDAGPLLHLASRAQLLEALDADAFRSAEPGEREAFDRDRFLVWLEVLVDEGLTFAADRIAHLPEELVVEALASVVRVLDEDALLLRARERATRDEDDETLPESAELRASLDGYTLEPRVEEAWDTTLALLCELDRGWPDLLERLLARCASVTEKASDEADTFERARSAAGRLLDDVEADRDARRAARGFVEPRDARGFLMLARTTAANATDRDAITIGYLRESSAHRTRPRARPAGAHLEAPSLLDRLAAAAPRVAASPLASTTLHTPLVDAMRNLRFLDAAAFAARVDELAYLTNVLVAAGRGDAGARMGTSAAAEATLATVEFGALLAAASGAGLARLRAVTVMEIADTLRWTPADVLFRRASGALVAGRWPGSARGFLRTRIELDSAIVAAGREPPRAPRV